MKNKNESLVKNLLTWFDKNKRELPFREEKNPYYIWISEIMAQQTQIETLIPYYKKFIQRFPDIQSLADANEDTILKYWEGLGYYSRAKNIHRTAKIIRDNYNCIFPDNIDEILKLPGIGPYTSGAIASIAFNYKVPAVDGNVLRVITRLNNWSDDISISTTKKKVTNYVQKLLPENAGDFNEALMELGALICSPKSPKCVQCPLVKECDAYKNHTTENIPLKSKKIRQKHITVEIGLLICNEEFYLVKRPDKGLLSNLWAFPTVEATSIPGEAIQKHLNRSFPNISEAIYAGKVRHVFTHVIWDMTIYRFNLSKQPENPNIDTEGIFVKPEELTADYALPTAFSKLLNYIDNP